MKQNVQTKKEYVTPEIEIIQFSQNEVILTDSIELPEQPFPVNAVDNLD